MLKYNAYLFVWPFRGPSNVNLYADEGTAYSERDHLREIGLPAEVVISSGFSADERTAQLRAYRHFYESKREALAALASQIEQASA